MGRKKLQQKPSDRSKFIFKGNPKTFYKSTVTIDFKVTKKHKIQKPSNVDVILPTYNKDGKYYTSTFILPYVDKDDSKLSQHIHKKKVQQSQREIDQKQIMIPKPRSKNKYCGVCRGFYQDYLQHIQSQQHQKSLNTSQFHRYIGILCRQFKQKNNPLETINFLDEKTESVKTKSDESEGLTSNLEPLIFQSKRENNQIIISISD